VSGRDNNGSFALFGQTPLWPARGTPLHVYHLKDEVFFVYWKAIIISSQEMRNFTSAQAMVFLCL
jgi:hypothetical protein